MEKQKEEPSTKYPRRDLSFTCSRRTFFRALFQEAAVVRGSLKGRQGYRLSELGSLPDHQLAQVRPIVSPDCEIFVNQGHVWSRPKKMEKAGKTETALKLFPMEKENLVVFNMFDGRHNLGEVASHLAQEMEWDEANAFAYARNLFLSLVQYLVCVPQDPLGPNG